MTKVTAAHHAIDLIRESDAIAVAGYGTNGVPELLLKALEERFLETGKPRDLTLYFAGGIGDGKDRGLNRLGHEGLLKRVIAGHFGLVPKIAKLALENRIEAYNFPEGVITHLYRNIAAGKYGIMSRTGLDTFIDPKHEGAKVNDACSEELVERITVGDSDLLYFKGSRLDVAIIRGTTADPDGNISLEREALSLENLEVAMAARNSGGIVLCQVERIADYNSIDPRHVRIPGFMVDCVVEAPPEFHMQNYDSQYDPSLSGEIKIPLKNLPKLPLDEKKVVLRRAAMELTQNSIVNLGVGMAAGVGNVANEEKIFDQIMLTVDSGVYGGVPLQGLGFGASVNYIASVEHATQFDFIDGGGLDIACLGFAECDARGSVNASKFSGRISGCGGFINISQNSKKVVFLGTFTSSGLKTSIEDGKLEILEEGKYCKFVPEVSQITFSGPRAGSEHRAIFYVTERCVFALREDGLELIEYAPGIDLERDILEQMPFRPVVNNPVEMASVLFKSRPMGLRERLADVGIERRIEYSPTTNSLFLDFSGMRVRTSEDIEKIVSAVDDTLAQAAKRVDAIVNYDGFWLNPDLSDEYMDAVKYVEERYYQSVARYTTSGFTRLQLARGLEERNISHDIAYDYVEAVKKDDL